MIKLYKKNEHGATYYREAWVHGKKVVEHWGLLGSNGKTKNHKFDSQLSEEENCRKVLTAALEDGFAEVDDEDMIYLIVEYELGTWGDAEDLDKRHALEDRLNEVLGWKGLGMVDGGSIGSGTMEVACVVVDYGIAERAIVASIANTEYGNYSRIYREGDQLSTGS
ncbi:hypothetical protein OAU50_08065 [Planctomycetota bacterium]|nr:hypothetical protein [Planctomycetota bacterium]